MSLLEFAGSSDSFMRQLRTKAQEQMDDLIACVGDQATSVEPLMVEGLPTEEMVPRTHDGDFVIICRPRFHLFWRVFSKQPPRRLTEQAHCEVLAVQEQELRA